MKKPIANCKHAREIIDGKWAYRGNERDGPCWKCGGELTPNEAVQTSFCLVCLKELSDKARVEIDAGRFVTADEMFEKMRSREGRQENLRRMEEKVYDVERCAPDCPERENLDSLRKLIMYARQELSLVESFARSFSEIKPDE